MKDKDGMEIIYWVSGNAGVCPKCGNWNAMLDTPRVEKEGPHFDGTYRRYEDLTCRDCGHVSCEGKYINVTMGMDTDNREYTGIAADGTEVSLGENYAGVMEYLKDHPTPDTW